MWHLRVSLVCLFVLVFPSVLCQQVNINLANLLSGLERGHIYNNDPCAEKPGQAPKLDINIDYLIIGGGPGGLQTASELLSALRNSTDATEAASTVLVVEALSDIGGNIKRVKLQQPGDYDGSFGSELWADLGAQRVNILTLTEERRLFHQLGIEMYASPFRNIINLRGRQTWCRTPYVQSHEHFPYYDSSPDPSDPFAYGDFCTYSDVYTHPTTGAYRGVRLPDTNFTGCKNYDNTDDGVCNSYPNNDPSYNAYQWLLQGSDAPAFDASVSGTTVSANYYFGDSYSHPLNSTRKCTVGVDCPKDRCLSHADWRTFVAGELATGNMQYHNEYANFLQGDNVGFFGDYEQGFGACSYINYQAREWNTASINVYPKGGMYSLISGLRSRIEGLGGSIYTNEPVTCINRYNPYTSPSSSTYQGSHSSAKYIVTTRSYRIFVKQFLFVAVPNPYLEDATIIGGDVLQSLRGQRTLSRARAQVVATVVMQWPPGQEAWFWSLLDKNGNYSLRQYGDTACFSRIEIIDTPYHRCTNAIRAVYSDYRCRQMYVDLVNQANSTGDWSKLTTRVLGDLRDAFPNVNIPEPVLTKGVIINPAWHWAKPSHDDISNEAASQWASNPLNGEPLCLIGEAYHNYYQGWVEGALRSSRQCLTTRFPATNPGTVGDQLQKGYQQRDSIVPGDGSFASPFALVPPHTTTRYFSNEEWWPFNYASISNNNEGAYCHKANIPFTEYTTINTP